MRHLHKYMLLATAALLWSCTPSVRLGRLLQAHPELTVNDTLILRDTLAIPAAEAETSLLIPRIAAPVIVERDRLVVEIRKQHDTLLVKGKCKADTVYRTHVIPVERIRLIKPERADLLIGRIPWIAGAVMALAIVAAVILRGRC